MLMTEFEVAASLKSSYFTNCSESVMKRRVRRFAKKNNIVPADQTEVTWLFYEADINKLATGEWDSH